MLVPQELDGDYFMESIHEKKPWIPMDDLGYPGYPYFRKHIIESILLKNAGSSMIFHDLPWSSMIFHDLPYVGKTMS